MNTQQNWMIDKRGALYLLPRIPDNSVDLILTDLPYGTTSCSWDIQIDLPQLWREYIRIIKYTGSVVLFASQPFTSELILSNIGMFKYCWTWNKLSSTGFMHAKNAPLKSSEDICVFSLGSIAHKPDKRRMKYFPQGLRIHNKVAHGRRNKTTGNKHGYLRPSQAEEYIQEFTNYPTNIIKFKKDSEKIHPTQKPLKLIKYLVKTYTRKGDTVHDSCLGSGTILEACKNLNRNCIGFEISNEWEYNYYTRLNLKKPKHP